LLVVPVWRRQISRKHEPMPLNMSAENRAAAVVVVCLIALLNIWYYDQRAKMTPKERREEDLRDQDMRNEGP
jgi:hypothetical protein